MANIWGRLGLTIGGALLGGWILGPALGIFGTTVGMFAGSYLGSMIFPTDYESKMPAVHDLPIQNSAVGIPIPIVYGTVRLAGNVIWLGDLDSYQVKHSAGGGKGGGGEQAVYETRYRRSFLIAICEGPASILRAWKGKKLISIDDFTSFNGNGNAGISELIGKDYAEYSNLCLVYFEDYELGNSQTLPNFIFEVSSGLREESERHFLYRGWQISKYSINYYYNRIKDNLDGTSDNEVQKQQELEGICAAYYYDYVFITSVATGKARLYKLDYNLELVTGWGTDGYIEFDCGRIGAPRVNQAGEIAIAVGMGDSENWNVCILNSDGSFKWTALPGSAYYIPRGDLEFLPNGNLIVSYFNNSDYLAIELSSQDGSLLNTFGNDKDIVNVPYSVSARSNGEVVILANYKGIFGVHCWPSTGGGQTARRWHTQIKDTEHQEGSVLCHSNGKVFACGRRSSELESNVWMFSGNGDYLQGFNTGDGLDEITKDLIEWRDGVVIVGYRDTNDEGDTGQINVFDGNLNYQYCMDLGDHEGWIAPVYSICQQRWVESTNVNFASMIKDLLTNERYGNYDESDLIAEDFDSIIAYCEENELKGSLAITEQKPLPDWIAYICSHFQGYFYEIGGKVGLNCYRSQDSVLSITQDDLVREGDEPPVHITKRKYSDTFNRVEATWSDRDNDYKTSVVPAFDRIDQRESGQVRTKTMDLRAITNKELASKMAWRIFIDQIYRFDQYAFRLGYKSMLLEVGDMIDVTDGHLLTAQKMRIMSVSEEKDGHTASITAVEDIADFYPAISYPIQQSEAAGDSDITLTDGTVFFREDLNGNKLYLSIIPGGIQCNGFYIYRSYNDESYDLIGKAAMGEITGGEANSVGTIQSNLPAHTAVIHCKDEAFDISIGTITDMDTAITDDDFFNNRKLARIGDEIVAYKTCEESTTEGVWRVSNLIRGLFGTKPVAHVSGESFNTLGIDFTYTLKESDIGRTLYFKVVSFYADEIQLVSEVSPQSHVVSGKYLKPLPVSLMRINGREGLSTYETVDVTIDWYFCSKTSGFGRGGYGNALWGAYIKDPLLEQLRVELEEEDGTDITDADFELNDYGEPLQLEILEADRDGKNPIRVKLTPGSHLWSDETRDILIEKI